MLAKQFLQRMDEVSLRPSVISFNNVINACAFSSKVDDDHDEVLTIALDVLKRAQDGAGANWITYQTAVRVICTFATDPGLFICPPRLQWTRFLVYCSLRILSF